MRTLLVGDEADLEFTAVCARRFEGNPPGDPFFVILAPGGGVMAT